MVINISNTGEKMKQVNIRPKSVSINMPIVIKLIKRLIKSPRK